MYKINPPSLTTIPTFSKYLALFLFITLPVAGFFLGIEYQKIITTPLPSQKFDQQTINPIPTIVESEWKTFSDTLLNFSVHYPPGMKIVFSSKDHLVIDTENGNLYDTPILDLYILPMSTDFKKSVIENYNSYCPQTSQFCTQLTPGIVPDSFTYDTTNTDYTSTVTYIKGKNQIFEFIMSSRVTKAPFSKSEIQQYNQILSTFKFTNQN